MTDLLEEECLYLSQVKRPPQTGGTGRNSYMHHKIDTSPPNRPLRRHETMEDNDAGTHAGSDSNEEEPDGGLIAELAGIMQDDDQDDAEEGAEAEEDNDEDEEEETSGGDGGSAATESGIGARIAGGASSRNSGSDSSKGHVSTTKKLFIKFMQIPEMKKKHGSLGGKLEDLDLGKLLEGPTLYNLFDDFGAYLAETTQLRSSTLKYSVQSCDNYLSTFKSFISTRLVREKGKTGVLADKQQCSKVRKGMVKSVTARCIADNVSVSKGHKVASRFDMIGLTILLIWAGTCQAAELLFLIVTLFQLAGRGSEVALIQHKNVTLDTPEDMQEEGPSAAPVGVFAVKFWRVKTHTESSSLSIFPHRDDMRLDWYFLWAYLLVMMDDYSENLFPTFYKKAADHGDNPDKATKNVSKFFMDLMKKFIGAVAGFANSEGGQVFTELSLVQGIQAGLSMHSGKKAAVNQAVENANLATTWICYRAGWVVKMIHSIFDYLVNSPANDRQVGKALSGWKIKNANGDVGGGYPPRIRDAMGISAEDSLKLEKFRNCLFYAQRGDNKMDDAMLSILTGSILMYLRKSIELVQKHPTKKYGEDLEGVRSKHKFMVNVDRAAEAAGITFETLLTFGDKIERDFVLRNLHYCNTTQYKDAVGEDRITIDTRPMMQYMQSMSQHAAEQDAKIRNLEVQLGQANNKLDSLTGIDDKLDRLLALQMASADDGITAVDLGAAEEDEESSPSRPSAAVLPENLSGQLAASAYKQYHIANFSGAYKAVLDAKETNKGNMSQVFSTIKRLVEHVNLFRTEHVPPLPPSATNGRSEEATQWRADLDASTGHTFEAIKAYVEQAGGKFEDGITVTNATKAMYALLGENEFPSGPDDESTFQNDRVKLRVYDKMVADKAAAEARAEEREKKRMRLSPSGD